MRVLLIIIGIISAVLGLALSILPFGPIAYLPLFMAVIFGVLAVRTSKADGKNTTAGKIVILLAVVGLIMASYRTVFDKNEVADDPELIEQEEESLEDAKKELEDIEID